MDMPSPRKVHRTPVPRVGGIAIVIASIIPIVIWVNIDKSLIGVLLGVVLLFLLGIVDDIKNLSYQPKFIIQILAIALIFMFGFVDAEKSYYAGQEIIPAILLVSIYLIFILGVTNAINLADGLDGLAGGEALLSFSIIGLLAYEFGNIVVLTVVLAVMGAVFGFLRFNTYPAKIFMGDTGSLFLGFLLGLLSVALTYGEENAYAKTLPLLLVGLPVFDTLMVIMVRIAKRQSPFTADRNHFHHRLLDNGLKHYQGVLVVYIVQGIYVLTAYFMRYQLDEYVVYAFIGISLITLAIGAIPWRWFSSNHIFSTFYRQRYAEMRRWANESSENIFTLLSACFLCYALIASLIVGPIDKDILFLLLSISTIGLLFLFVLRSKPCNWIERVAIHVMIVLSIYMGNSYRSIDIDYINRLEMILIIICFLLIGILLFSKLKFSGSPLDFLLVAVALIVPNLPGSPISDPNLSYLALKLIALFYCVEFVLFNLNQRWWLVRVALIFCAGIPIVSSLAS